MPERVLRLVESEIARRDVRRHAPTETAAAWEFACAYRRGHVRFEPLQVRSEILGFLELVRQSRPRRIVEIGTLRGGTLFLIARAAAAEATLVSVDMPQGPFGGGYTRSDTRLIRSFGLPSQTIELVRGDSHLHDTVSAVRSLVAEADLVFIDGDHSLEGVRADFDNYGPLVREGMIAFHDIVSGPAVAVGQVPEFWAELKQLHVHSELVENWNQGGYGIGVLHVGAPRDP